MEVSARLWDPQLWIWRGMAARRGNGFYQLHDPRSSTSHAVDRHSIRSAAANGNSITGRVKWYLLTFFTNEWDLQFTSNYLGVSILYPRWRIVANVYSDCQIITQAQSTLRRGLIKGLRKGFGRRLRRVGGGLEGNLERSLERAWKALRKEFEGDLRRTFKGLGKGLRILWQSMSLITWPSL